MKCFIPNDDDDVKIMPEQLQRRYINSLLEIRNEIQIKMQEHTDKYDGSCLLKEKIIYLQFRD